MSHFAALLGIDWSAQKDGHLLVDSATGWCEASIPAALAQRSTGGQRTAC
jgi:hypothetical protein